MEVFKLLIHKLVVDIVLDFFCYTIFASCSFQLNGEFRQKFSFHFLFTLISIILFIYLPCVARQCIFFLIFPLYFFCYAALMRFKNSESLIIPLRYIFIYMDTCFILCIYIISTRKPYDLTRGFIEACYEYFS